MSNEDFQTQSEGYWEEVGRVANLRDSSGSLTAESQAVQDTLRKRFAAIHDIGGTAPQQLLGHLVGGSVQVHVDRALGPGANIKEFVDTNTPLGGQTNRGAVSTRIETTIPVSADLANAPTRAQYKVNLLATTPAGRAGGRPAPSTSAKVLAEGLAYNVLPVPERQEQLRVLDELKFSAAASPQATDSYNALVDEIHAAYDRRALEVVQRAVSKFTDPVQVDRIRTAAEAAAANEKAGFTKI